MEPSDEVAGKSKPHRGKFSEGMLDDETIIHSLDIRPGQTLVDAGCGTGYMAKQFARRVGNTGRVIALDKDRYFLKKLAEETRDTVIEIVEGDITDRTPLDGSSADLIYLSTVVHIFSPSQWPGFVREVRRLLKPGGLLAIVEMDKKEMVYGPPIERRHSPEDLRRLIPLTPVTTLRAGEDFYLQVFRNGEVGTGD